MSFLIKTSIVLLSSTFVHTTTYFISRLSGCDKEESHSNAIDYSLLTAVSLTLYYTYK